MANKFVNGLKDVLKVVAPTLGAAIGGPIGGTAGMLVAKALGSDTADEDELAAAIQGATPEQILKLREADAEFQRFLKEADIKIAALDNDDRANARAREMALKDYTPSVLSGAITVGFFGVLLWMLKYGLPMTGEQALLVMLGSLGTAWIQVVAYFFGSSAGSKQKTDAMASMKK